MKKLNFEQMEAIAQSETKKSLRAYIAANKDAETGIRAIFEDKDFTIGSTHPRNGEKGIFELYISHEDPLRIKILVLAIVDRKTGDCDVRIFYPTVDVSKIHELYGNNYQFI